MTGVAKDTVFLQVRPWKALEKPGTNTGFHYNKMLDGTCKKVTGSPPQWPVFLIELRKS
jgi:hypothetical protein